MGPFLSRCRKIQAVTLQSSRLDMRTTFAAGFVEEDRLLLFPLDEVRTRSGARMHGCTQPAAGDAHHFPLPHCRTLPAIPAPYTHGRPAASQLLLAAPESLPCPAAWRSLRRPACSPPQALQLRPSLAHLDREKETATKKKGKAEEEEEQQQKPPELMQLTVQVRRAGRARPACGAAL